MTIVAGELLITTFSADDRLSYLLVPLSETRMIPQAYPKTGQAIEWPPKKLMVGSDAETMADMYPKLLFSLHQHIADRIGKTPAPGHEAVNE